MTNINKNIVQKLIGKGKTLQAIEFLRSCHYVKDNLEIGNELIICLNTFKSLKKDKRKGVISYEDSKTTITRLNYSILNILEEIPTNELVLGLPPLPNIPRPKEPFVGLKWFTRDEAPIFFGRDKDIQKLYNWVIDGERLILLYGQSGTGKSSLLHAGLLPRLEHFKNVFYYRRNIEEGTIKGLKKLLLKVGDQDALIVIDQFEEIYTNPNIDIEKEDYETFSLIQSALIENPNLQLILGFRKEYLAEFKENIESRALDYSSCLLKPLSYNEIVNAITGIESTIRLKRKYNIKISDGLPDKIAKDILQDKESHIAPLLQILLRKMWDSVKENHEEIIFDLDHYLKFQESSLDNMLTSQINVLKKTYQDEVNSGLILDILKCFTSSKGTSNQVNDSELISKYENIDYIIQLLKDVESLFLIGRKKNGTQFSSRLAHDALAPLIIERFNNSDLPSQRAFRIIESKKNDISLNRPVEFSRSDIKIIKQGIKYIGKLSTSIVNKIKEEEERISELDLLLLELEKFKERDIKLSKPIIESSIISGLAHNQGNLVSSIIFQVEKFKDYIHNFKEDKIPKDNILEYLQKLMNPLTTLSSDYLKLREFRKADSGAFSNAHIAKIIDDLSQLVNMKILTSRISFRKKIKSNPELYCDANSLLHALLNIVLNAIDATSNIRKGEIILLTKLNIKKTILFIEIINNGPIIKHENLTRIFDPYFSTKPNGTGLGLSTAKYIIENIHSGQISVESNNKFTNFTVKIPLKDYTVNE